MLPEGFPFHQFYIIRNGLLEYGREIGSILVHLIPMFSDAFNDHTKWKVSSSTLSATVKFSFYTMVLREVFCWTHALTNSTKGPQSGNHPFSISPHGNRLLWKNEVITLTEIASLVDVIIAIWLSFRTPSGLFLRFW